MFIIKSYSNSLQPSKNNSYQVSNVVQSTNQPSYRRISSRTSLSNAQALQQQNQFNIDSNIQSIKPQKKNQIAIGNLEKLRLYPIHKSKTKEPSKSMPDQIKRKGNRIYKKCNCKDGCQNDKCSCFKAGRMCPKGCLCKRVGVEKKCMNINKKKK